MKLKLTPELFILQDADSHQPISASSQDEETKEKEDINDDRTLKQINRTRRFIETPEYELLNSNHLNHSNHHQNNQNEINQLNQIKQINSNNNKATSRDDHFFRQPLEPNVKIISNNGRLALDKRFVVNKRPRREIIQSDIRCITLNKEKFSSSFGITIRGGIEFNKPLIIASIQRNSTADKCRSLFLGDLIVELNGQSTYPLRFSHDQAMKLIKNGGQKLYLTVKHLTMYNRPIARCWQKQMNMNWLNNCENNSKIEDDFNMINYGTTMFTTAKLPASSTSQQLLGQSAQNSSNQLLTDCEQFSETNTLSNLTTKDDLLTPSPLNDEGVYTGLSNDALSSSECTSNASGFSSDYVNSIQHNSASICKAHDGHNNGQLVMNCSSCLKNSKNNNCCTKCIVNMNHQNNNNITHHHHHDLQRRRRSSNNKSSQPVVVDQLNTSNNEFTNKENISYTFRNQNAASIKANSTNGNQEMISSCSSFSDHSSSRAGSSNRQSLVDIVSVNLINCYFTKYIHNTDNIRRNGMEVRWFKLHNQSNQNSQSKVEKQLKRSIEVNSAVINFNDIELAQQFQLQINHYLSKLNESYMFSFNRGLAPQNRILFMGWISLALPKSVKFHQVNHQLSSLDYNWQPKYLIIKGGEMLLYDCPPDYLLEKIKYANDTLMEFNELSDLLVNKNGQLACSITLNNDLNKPKPPNTQQNRTRSSLTRHLSIRGQDSSINKSFIRQSEQQTNNEQRILTETNNKQKAGNRLICTLTRNLSLKTAKENRYKQQQTNSKLQRTNLHCTLPRNQTIDLPTSHQSDRAQNLRRTTATNNLLNDRQQHKEKEESEWKNEPIIFKAYESVLRQLRPDEQLDRRENCLLALTTKSDNTTSNPTFKPNPMSNFSRKESNTNHSTGDLDSNCNSGQNDSLYSRKNSLDSNLNESERTPVSLNTSMIAYLTVEHSDNISQILKSWNVATMHSVIQLARKSFYVMSEGRYCCLTLDWTSGFTLYDGPNVKWSFKFSQLKNSSDDGFNTLWLSFQSIKHQPVLQQRIQARPMNLALSSFSNNQSNNSLNSSLDSVDQYSRRAMTPNSFDTFDSVNLNGGMMNNQSNSNGHLDYSTLNNNHNNSNYLQTNRTEFRIKKSIETKEISCSNLQHLIYCMHSFLSAKVVSVTMPNAQQQTPINGILV